MRFTRPDPLATKYYPISPYVYALNNPVRYIDPDGRAPGDIFKTIRAAVKDWGKYYNGASILRGKEFGSTIYTVKKNGKTYYVYSEAAIGNESSVKRSEAPNGEPRVAIIHSHGKYDEKYEGNYFSAKDKNNSVNLGVDSYIATPEGSLKKYDPEKREATVVSTDLPSDPNDPERKNEIMPVDILATQEQEKRQDSRQTELEQKKEAYKNSFINR